MPPQLQGKSTAKQCHAALKLRYEADHMGPPKVTMPYPDLLDILEYKTAYKAACEASETEKGERPDRDPQVTHAHCLWVHHLHVGWVDLALRAAASGQV